tara:strand:- start:2385 stop:3221 length:837 start_codon:yes stop_codon:yes gene_type:complete
MSFKTGLYLREQRKKMGYTQKEAATRINISVRQLRAIEEGQPEELPGIIYAVGFVRNYAQLLQLDENKVAAFFKREYLAWQDGDDQQDRKPAQEAPALLTDNRSPSPSMLLISGVMFLCFVAVWAVFDTHPQSRGVTAAAIPDAPVVTRNQNSPYGASYGAPSRLADKEAIRARRIPSRITIMAMETAWVELINPENEKLLYQDTLQAGQGIRLPDRASFQFSTGNAGALQFVVDGKKLLPIGQPGDILQDITITADELLRYDSTVPRPQNGAPVAPD